MDPQNSFQVFKENFYFTCEKNKSAYLVLTIHLFYFVSVLKT